MFKRDSHWKYFMTTNKIYIKKKQVCASQNNMWLPTKDKICQKVHVNQNNIIIIKIFLKCTVVKSDYQQKMKLSKSAYNWKQGFPIKCTSKYKTVKMMYGDQRDFLKVCVGQNDVWWLKSIFWKYVLVKKAYDYQCDLCKCISQRNEMLAIKFVKKYVTQKQWNISNKICQKCMSVRTMIIWQKVCQTK